MDEYAAGVSAGFETNEPSLLRGLELMGMLKKDLGSLAARNRHELLRCWELVHRAWVGEAHMRHLLFRPETPASGFFVRNHFPIPSVDIASWRLSVTGELERPVRLKLDDLRCLPSKEIGALLECAGNSRAAVQPPIEGLLWDHGGVGSARWRGVPLYLVLEQTGLLATAKEVLLEGADSGKEHGEFHESNYAMSLPMD